MIAPPSRKDPRNFGAEFSNAQAPLAYAPTAGRFSAPMPERVIEAILRGEIDRLLLPESADLLNEFFGHFFDPMTGEAERRQYATNFTRKPPTVVLGYARTAAEFPVIAIVLESDRQAEEALGQYLGQTRPDEPADAAKEFLGSMFEATYGVHIYAEHPDVCVYLYHLVKAILIGSLSAMQEAGLVDPHYDGSDLEPQPEYMPENMFVRRLGISVKAITSVPAFLSPDPIRVRTGVWAHDIVVSGLRGGVKVSGEDGC